MSYTSIAASRIDVDSPAEELLFDDLHDRDEANRHNPFMVEYTEVSTTSGTLVVVHSEDIYIPVWATKITLAGQYHHTGASFGAIDWRIGGTTIGGSLNVFDSSYPADTVRRTLDPLPAGYAGTTKTLDLYLAAPVTTTMFSKQSDGPVSRFYS